MRVLFPIDGSVCAQKTLEWASSFLDKQTYNILLLIVIFPAIDKDQREIEESTAIKLLEEAQTLFEVKGFTVEKADIIHEYLVANPSGAICKYAEKENVDQIIIGSHGYQGLAKFLMGSVALEVFQKSHIPVLVLNNQLQHIDESSSPDYLAERK